MPKSLRTPRHERLVTLLVEARAKAGLTQAQVAEALGRPQSFIAKVEGRERRLDVIEFIALARALGLDPARVIRDIERV